MSKVTNPNTEASVTCGFYNSLNDRKYDAKQMSSLFDGIINDGVFASIDDCFVVSAYSGNTVIVGPGKAWFNHTWTRNDADLPIECEESEALLDRVDAIVIEVNSADDVRDNFIKCIKGTPSSDPSLPVLEDSTHVHQYVLCYIYRTAGSKEITQADIVNMVGSDITPFVTGILEVVSMDTLLGQWRGELDRFVQNEETNFNKWYEEQKILMNDVLQEFNSWADDEKNAIMAWFENIKTQIDDNVAVNLQLQVNKSEVERILINGFVDGYKNFSDDGTVIMSEDSKGRTLVKTFTNNFLTCTTVLRDSSGNLLGEMVKNFSSDGKTINSEVNII